MELKHTFAVPLPVEQTWQLLMDIEKVAICFPGAQLLSADDERFEGTVSVKLGPVAMRYKGAAEFTTRDAVNHLAVIDAKGAETGGGGNAGATVTLRMAPTTPKTTTVTVDTDLSITGRPAQFGRGVITEVSNSLLDQFTSNLRAQLAGEPVSNAGGSELNLFAATWRPVAMRVVPVLTVLMVVAAIAIILRTPKGVTR